MSDSGRIARSTSWLVLITGIQKGLGFLEKLALAYFFGTGLETDAYLVAYSAPFLLFLMLRDVIEPSLLPSYLKLKGWADRQGRLVGMVGLLLAAGLLVVVIAVVGLAPWLVTLLAPGFGDAERGLASDLMRWMAPAILFLGLSTVTGAVLRAHRRFVLPALGEVLFRAAPLVFLVALGDLTGLAMGVVIGSVGQLVVQAIGWLVTSDRKPSVGDTGGALREVGSLAWPLSLGLFFSYVGGPVVDMAVASTFATGGLTAVAFARKMVEVPLTVVPSALGVVLLPFLAQRFLDEDGEQFGRLSMASIRAMALAFGALTAVFAVLRVPIVRLLLERGAFTAESTAMTAQPLLFYSLGLVPFALELVLLPPYFARRDTRTPIIIEAGTFGLNVALIFALIGPLSLGGIALATTLAKAVKVAILLFLLGRREASLRLRELAPFALRLALALAVMAGTLIFTARALAPVYDPEALISQVLYLALAGGAGGIAFLVALWLLKVEEVRWLGEALSARLEGRWVWAVAGVIALLAALLAGIGFFFLRDVPLVARYLPRQAATSTPTATATLQPAHTPVADSSLSPSPTPTQRPMGQIAFETDRDGNYEVYIMNEDGSDQRNLTNFWADDAAPSWSPDGSRIVFVSWRTGVGSFKLTNGSIYTMLVPGEGEEVAGDGADPTQLTSDDFDDDWPTWSGDGERIAFVTDRDGNSEVYSMRADGTEQANITSHPGEDHEPNWSPAGDLIAFVSDRDGNSEVYVMAPDGSGQRNLTRNPAHDRHPVFAHDGRRLAFVTNRDGNDEIYVIDVESGVEARLTHNEYGDWKASWSPDGERLAFYTKREEGNKEIYMMPAPGAQVQGRDEVNISRRPSSEEFPSWRPDF
jgi:murein biosynthesis integral membrane protein MurJ